VSDNPGLQRHHDAASLASCGLALVPSSVADAWYVQVFEPAEFAMEVRSMYEIKMLIRFR
jgi:hypothetical protein